MNLKASFLLSAAFMPFVAAQSEFLTCVMTGMVSGDIVISADGDMSGLIDSVNSVW